MAYLDQTPGAHLIYDVAQAPHLGVRVPRTVGELASQLGKAFSLA
jgi:hypothetical protein